MSSESEVARSLFKAIKSELTLEIGRCLSRERGLWIIDLPKRPPSGDAGDISVEFRFGFYPFELVEAALADGFDPSSPFLRDLLDAVRGHAPETQAVILVRFAHVPRYFRVVWLDWEGEDEQE